ncbi:thiamine pyrophosphate-dependent enzyme [Ilumatobacter sp.]|uniref:thiamine pyrophosphate-dependent enzyme n=1 Tax=Ilumatobacter sp. TaxID=1967498 RepID=UPI003C328E87
MQLVDTVSAALPSDATVTVDAGAHFLAIMPLWPVANPFDLLISNGLSTMGYAVPAAIGAAVARPDRPVVALVGDGGLGMTMAELETIARLDLPITVVVFNDAALSLIEIKQRDQHGGAAAVKYRETDFAAIARASSIGGLIARSADELRMALDGDWTRPRLVDARIDPSSYRALIATTRG